MTITELPYGPKALIFQVAEQPSRELTLRLEYLAQRLSALPFVQEARISYSELLVIATSTNAVNFVRNELDEIINKTASVDVLPKLKNHLEIQVSYSGPDMESVMKQTGLALHEVIQLHTSQTYTVHALGFQPGFAFLGTLPPQLQLPRKAMPRKRVPPNSVAIAADQTAIYPHASPGGWHLIGIAQQPVFDLSSDNLSVFQPGDTVQFIDADKR
ncbi:MAG: 5-oxoprolinase subunit PxpB [Saprospiraceae bacterium]